MVMSRAHFKREIEEVLNTRHGRAMAQVGSSSRLGPFPVAVNGLLEAVSLLTFGHTHGPGAGTGSAA
jgi:hypothetical protein